MVGSRCSLVIKKEVAPREIMLRLGGPVASVGEKRPALVHGGIAVGMSVDVAVQVSVNAPVGAVNVRVAVSVGDAVGMVTVVMFGYDVTGCSTNLVAERNGDC